jgi:hypothetical protein
MKGDCPGGLEPEYAYECFLIAASHGSGEAYFELGRYYR